MSEFESVEEELKFMADISDDRDDSESSMMYMRYIGHIRTLAAQRDVLVERQDALIGGYESAKAFAEEYLTQRDELMQARNGVVENNDALHIQLAELRAQRDEGLAREAELRELLRTQTLRADAAVGDANDAERHLAEAEKLLRQVCKEDWSGAKTAHIEEFLADSPGCADGQKS